MHKLMASEATHKAKKLTEIFSKSKNFFSLFLKIKIFFSLFQGNKNKKEMRSVQALEQEKCES